MSDWSKDPAFREYAAHALGEMLPKLTDSAVAVSLAPNPDGPYSTGDVKYWVELGASIMLDKPIFVVAHPGQKLPARLSRVADEVAFIDMNDRKAQQELSERIALFVDRMEREEGG